MLLLYFSQNNTLKKSYIIVFFLLFTFINAQVGINTSTPDASSVLEIKSDNKGLLIPRLNLSSEYDASTIPSPATSLLVWNKGEGGLTTKGFYYWDGKWNAISGGSGSSAGNWLLTGNNIGNSNGPNTNLSIGTSGWDDFIIKANSKTVQRLGVDGTIVIGENAVGTYQSISIGMGASSTSGNEAIAIGKSATANGYESLAIGYNARTDKNSETAVGYNTVTAKEHSTAIGSGASATGHYSVALGYGSSTNQDNAIVLGGSNANVGIGTSTPNVNSKLDVNGSVKLGPSGTVQKNQFAFTFSSGMSFSAVQPGKVVSVDIAIPSGSQPTSTNAVIVVNPSPYFDNNFTVVSAKLLSTNSVRVYLMNITESQQAIYYGEFRAFISEY